MLRVNDIVVRISNPLEGGLRKGQRAVVTSLVDDKYMTLDGHAGQFLIANFRVDTLGSPCGAKATLSDLEAVEQALNTIDQWNRTHPTGSMISIEAHPAQDGGSTFFTSTEDFNDVSLMVEHLGTLASKEERKSTLRKAMGLLQVELEG